MSTLNLPPSVSGPSGADDIIKMGVLRKGKKGKKRFFVLRQDSYMAPASIDCYENEKRFRQGISAKLSVKLKDVFNLNKTVDGKMKHCVGIFARDESLKLGCDNEQDQEAWLQTLFNVYMNTKCGTPEEHLRQNYDFCWDVMIVKDKGLTEKNTSLSGGHRFCLNSCSIYLYKTATDDPCIEFPLVYISNYGHKSDTLYLRVGRSAVTGSGELWMQTDDAVVAQHIHETMKNILEENHELRQRSSSNTEPRRQSSSAWSSSRANSTVSCGSGIMSSNVALSTNADDRSSTLSVLQQQPQSRTRAISESEKTLSSIMRKVSAPPPSTSYGVRRYRTESESSTEMDIGGVSSAIRKITSPSLFERRKISSVSLRGHLSHLQHRSTTGQSSETLSASSAAPLGPLLPAGGYTSTTPRSASHSPSAFHPPINQWVPPGQSPLTTSPANLSSTDSVASASTAADHDAGMRFSHWQMFERTASLEYVVGSQPTIVEEGSGSGAEYLPMQPPTTTRNSCPPKRSRQLINDSTENTDSASYVEMNIADKARRMTGDSGYMEMASPMRAASSVTSEMPSSSSCDQVVPEGYTPMGPSSLGRSSGNHSRQTSWHLEEVRSYISDSDSTCSSNIPPSRAYSLGSKPTTIIGSTYVTPSTSAGPSSSAYLNKIVLTLADDRKRAHSVGSWNKQEMKGSTSLVVPQHIDKNNMIRQRSESFGSGRSTPGSRRFTDSSKRSNQSDDLVEMDFGTSPGMGRSPSGSLGSSESLLNRSRTGSLGNGTMNNKLLWSPKVEQINEDLNLLQQTPSAKFIQQRLLHEQTASGGGAHQCASSNKQQSTDYMMMGAKDSSDYSMMSMGGGGGGGGNIRLGHDLTPTAGGGDYVSMDTGSKSDYVIMNSRQKFLTRQSDSSSSARSTFGQQPDVETSSGYSSTGDCSTVAETTTTSSCGGAQQKPLSSPSISSSTAVSASQSSNYNNTSPKMIGGGGGVAQPTCRFHDVQGEEELMRRLARVEMSSPKHSPPAAPPTETYVNLNFGAKSEEHSAEAVYENMNLRSPVLLAPMINLTVQDNKNVPSPSTSPTSLSVKRSHSMTNRSESPSNNHQRKFSENQSAMLVIVTPDQQQQAPKSPKSRSPNIKGFFSSFGRGQVKVPRPQSGSKDDSSSASNSTPIASPLPQRCLIIDTPPSGLSPTAAPSSSASTSSSILPSVPTPVNVEYAQLDLNSSQNIPAGRTNSSPKVMGANNGLATTTTTNAANNVAAASLIPQIFTTSDEKDEAVIYSQIDVNKSEGLKKPLRQC